ncbi:MAG: phage integrase N-terminal SAM-like domain-containing protein [Chitinispirillaceae bacterium]|nr:phage integrase N-terminal SAM-like domain-containing protein [Chitinispirillaceae bacterium]
MKMQTFRKPHQWLNFWLEKYVEVLSGLKYSGEQRKLFWATLKTFLETLPGNPRNIPLESVRSFIENDPSERLPPILLFYLHIAPSKPHIEMLKKIESVAVNPPLASNEDPVQQFRTILLNRQFSQRTVKNYCTIVAAYLKWLPASRGDTSIDKIEQYRLYLAKEKRLAPRTIALHTAALKLFYQRIIDGGFSDPLT